VGRAEEGDKGVGGGGKGGGEKIIDSKEALKNAAKDRLFAITKLNAENAMKAFAVDLMSDDDDSDEDEDDNEDADKDNETGESEMMIENEPKKSKKKVKKVEEICIICKEKKEDSPLGYLCFIQSSNVLKHISNHYYLPSNSTSVSSSCASPAASSFSQFHSLYRVVARDGCQVFSHPSLPSSSASSASSSNSLHYSYHGDGLLGTIPFNENVYVSERKGNWIHILSPINGYALLFKPNDPYYSEHIPVTENALSVISSFSKQYCAILSPVTNLLYNNNSGTRLYGK
jgi:hypothetical protein